MFNKVKIDMNVDKAAKKIMGNVLASYRKKLSRLRCPVHQQEPKLTIKGSKVRIDGCCQEFEDKARAVVLS